MATAQTLKRADIIELRESLRAEKESRVRKLELDALVISAMYVSPWRSGGSTPGKVQRTALELIDEYIVTE